MRIKHNVNFEELQPLSIHTRSNHKKRKHNAIPALMKQYPILKIFIPALQLICPSQKIFNKCINLLDTSYSPKINNKTKINVKFKELQSVNILNKFVLRDRTTNHATALMKRYLITKIFLSNFHSISPSRRIPSKIIQIPGSYKNNKIILERYNCLLTEYITSVPIDFHVPSNKTFIQRRLIPISKFFLFINERSFQKLELDYKSTITRLKRLKEDISVFQKNRFKEEKKIRTIIKTQLLKEIIPALEELERAKNIKNRKIKSKKIRKFISPLYENLLIVYNSFIKNTGLAVITPSIGELYDERLHTVLSIIYRKDIRNNSIVDVVKSGYILNGEILKHSQVILSTNNPNHPNISSKHDTIMSCSNI